MITKEIKQQIIDLCKIQPRSISEIATHIKKNWRTADKYAEYVSQETGLIAIKVFRGGTQGALKIAYWNQIESARGNAYQDALFKRIVNSNRRDGFSPIDMYQFVNKEKRNAYLMKDGYPVSHQINFQKIIASAEDQLLLFSGNLSWLRERPIFMKILRERALSGIKIKILTRIDTSSKKEVEHLLQYNKAAGKDLIEIRHCAQPLRAVIVDDKIMSLKEVFEPNGKEIKKRMYQFYKISDIEWILWIQKIFWHLWAQSIDAKPRLEVLDELEELL